MMIITVESESTAAILVLKKLFFCDGETPFFGEKHREQFNLKSGGSDSVIILRITESPVGYGKGYYFSWLVHLARA